MRVRFEPGRQRAFLAAAQRKIGADLTTLAEQLGVCPRTVRDWRRARWHMSESALEQMCRLSGLPRPEGVTLLPDHWSVHKAGRLGAHRRMELYGPPGTAEGRSRGGQNAQRRFRENPDYYRARGVAVRKPIQTPPRSSKLAECIGIMLGDGGLTRYQATVTLHSTLEIGYADYVSRLMTALFGIAPVRRLDEKDHTLSLIVSSVELVEYLESLGLKCGNKVRQQVDVPAWIWDSPEHQTHCLRGLMDTDGCVYRHSYVVNGTRYAYMKLCFTSYSAPLLGSAKRMFETVGLGPTIHRYDGHRLYLHDSSEVRRYVEVVGTNNPRHRERFSLYWRGGRVVDRSALLMR